MFIKDILVYPDKIIITFNYIPKNRKKQTKTDLKELEDSLESADTEAFSFNEGSYEFIDLAPKTKNRPFYDGRFLCFILCY